MEEKKLEKEVSTEELTQQVHENIKATKKEINKGFNNVNTLPRWPSYIAVSKFKSVRRAVRRGLVDLYTGIIYPDRPFNNKKPTRGRKMNELRKEAYEQYKRRRNC